MHRNSNITGNLKSTFLAAGIFDFGHLQHIDFQRLFYYKNTPSFTGKEKDSETGFYYFGARYYDPSLSGLFLSVDPLADKYPSFSPYAYCAWNPVKLVDPDGKEIDDYFSYEGKYLGSDNATSNKIRIISETSWNNIDKNENGYISHNEGLQCSMLFSQASSEMSENAQLEVYNHYNPTGCELFVDIPKEHKLMGMNTHTNKGKSKIGIYLENNRKGMKICDYADEIISCFIHEERHVMDHKTKKYTFKYEYEQSAINAQVSHKSFCRTRPEFRRAVANYARRDAMMPDVIVEWWNPGK